MSGAVVIWQARFLIYAAPWVCLLALKVEMVHDLGPCLETKIAVERETVLELSLVWGV